MSNKQTVAPQPQTKTVTLSINDWQNVVTGLRELPYKQSAETIGRIIEQVNKPEEDEKGDKK